MKDERALYLDWPSVLKLLLAGLGGMLFFTFGFMKSGDMHGRWASCFMGLPFLIMVMIAVLTGIQKWMLDGKEGGPVIVPDTAEDGRGKDDDNEDW